MIFFEELGILGNSGTFSIEVRHGFVGDFWSICSLSKFVTFVTRRFGEDVAWATALQWFVPSVSVLPHLARGNVC